MLHMTTVKYVLLQHKSPLHDDLGHELFKNETVAKEVLDALSVAPPLVVIVGIALLRDVRCSLAMQSSSFSKVYSTG